MITTEEIRSRFDELETFASQLDGAIQEECNVLRSMHVQVERLVKMLGKLRESLAEYNGY